jgi:hypothetical protein
MASGTLRVFEIHCERVVDVVDSFFGRSCLGYCYKNITPKQKKDIGLTTYGYSKQLDFSPYPDELPRFYLAKWK